MAKKKVTVKKAKGTKARPMAKKTKSAKSSTTPTRTAAAKPVRKLVAAKKSSGGAPSLGRPLVTAEEKLYMLFKEDYHARQIFEFLRVETVGELEQFSPQQIVKLLSKPIQTTVDRVRRKLAEKHRHLQDDGAFAAEVLKTLPINKP